MQHFQLTYESPELLRESLERKHFQTNARTASGILIQVFVGKSDQAYMDEMFLMLKEFFPKAVVVGVTTEGEIADGEVLLHKTLLSFTFFEKTTLDVLCFDADEQRGEASALVKDFLAEKKRPSLKGLMILSNVRRFDTEQLLYEVSEQHPELPVFGAGASSEEEAFQYVFFNEEIIERGMVMVAFSGTSLFITQDYLLNWKAIGRSFEVTDARGNLLREADGLSGYELYRRYLGRETADELPGSALDFPLLVKRNGTLIARNVADQLTDGSLLLTGNIRKGDRISFAYADLEVMLRKSEQRISHYRNESVEAAFCYYSVARKRFLGDDAHKELKHLAGVAPNTGFFSYGEFFHSDKQNHLLNESVSLVMMSENYPIRKPAMALNGYRSQSQDHKTRVVNVLSHLTQTVTEELQQSYEELKALNKEISRQNEEISEQRDNLETQHDLVTAKNDEIEDQHKKMTASINYAQRIQQAMLPPKDKIKEALPESFVFFRPRDVVSGDFYWFTSFSEKEKPGLAGGYWNSAGSAEERDNKVILTAADCTGHGVPGAFMSMIGNSLLTQAVQAKALFEPHLILEFLHRGVRKALKQDNTQNRDGMDISVCTIDTRKKTLHFAGAKNPLIVIENGVMTEVKGDRMAVGGKDYENKRFTRHKVSWSGSAMFYMFSDGFQDQFGGTEKRKFMRRRFKELLLAIHEKPMAEQEKILDSTLRNWMEIGNQKQVDDILVMGFRVS